jgi:hypothetical protein
MVVVFQRFCNCMPRLSFIHILFPSVTFSHKIWTGENLAELHYVMNLLIVENYHLIPLLYTYTTTILN